MAVITQEVREHVVGDAARSQGVRVAWGGVWSGFLVATGVFLLLSTLGLAIGVSSADVRPGEDASGRAFGISAAVWTGVSLLVSLFIGGLVATRSSAIHDRGAGLIDGVLIWVLSILAIMYMASSGIGMLANSAFGLLGGVTQGAAAAVRNVDIGELANGDVDQILARLDDPKTVQAVAAATGTSQEEARSTLAGIRGRVDAARDNPQQAATEARNGLRELPSKAGARVERAAAQAQPYATATMWSTLAAMLVGLLASIGGAMVGRRQVERRLLRVGDGLRGERTVVS